MIVQAFFVKGLAHSSYLLGGTNSCAIVDPRRDVEVYVDAAREMQLTITHILETHLHADFISGHLELARATGAKIYSPRSAESGFDHIGVGEGDTFDLEHLRIRVLETPGHTPEHISYVVSDTTRAADPVGVFCGDTLFVGDVGRPDLFPGQARALASSLYDSLHKKLLTLPDFCEVYPAHGAGSLCGRALAAKRQSTIGYERKYNAALQISDREAFIKSLTEQMPAAPDHFSRCSAINGRGPALYADLPALEELEPQAFAKLAKQDETVVLDTRSYESYGGQHCPGAYHVDLGGNFATFCGWVLPPEKEILLVASHEGDIAEAAVWLGRVGFDRIRGYLNGGMFAWARAGLPTSHVGQISATELHELTTTGDGIVLVDTRAPGEHEAFSIKGSINIPAPDLRSRHGELDPAAQTVVLCSTGHRSSLGASILKRHGFRDVVNVAGGITGYSAAGYAPECPVCLAPHGPRAFAAP
jgi:glyoxylase-like metal-dependent hydrolase (beta-lactamase superfamily II)/rhodanese-related sulfurtransferase